MTSPLPLPLPSRLGKLMAHATWDDDRWQASAVDVDLSDLDGGDSNRVAARLRAAAEVDGQVVGEVLVTTETGPTVCVYGPAPAGSTVGEQLLATDHGDEQTDPTDVAIALAQWDSGRRWVVEWADLRMSDDITAGRDEAALVGVLLSQLVTDEGLPAAEVLISPDRLTVTAYGPALADSPVQSPAGADTASREVVSTAGVEFRGSAPAAHPHAGIIAGLRELADVLEAGPEIPSLRSLSVSSALGTLDASGEWDDDASVRHIRRAAEILGVEARSDVHTPGRTHWVVGRGFGPGGSSRASVQLMLSYISNPPEATPLPACGPVPPKLRTYSMTPTRLRMLGEVGRREVYAEAGQAWHVDGSRLTARITELLASGWVQEGPSRSPGSRWYELTDAGREQLGGAA